MQNNDENIRMIPIVDPLDVNDEKTHEELAEEEKEAEVIPEDFEHFNLDAVEKLKESKDE